MKRTFCILFCLTFSMVMSAQTSGGQITRPSKKAQHQSSAGSKRKSANNKQTASQQVQQTAPPQPEQVTPQQTKLTTGTINGHEWVDLGLPSGIKWATCNVEAYSSSGYGRYYAWGEITPKLECTVKNSKTYGKYFNNISGNPQYDAARANWGGSWRLPTKAEMEELINRCTWTCATNNSHKGYYVKGPNGNSIFLPAAGWHHESSYEFIENSGYYWSAEPYGNNYSHAYCLYFKTDGHTYDVRWNFREYGRSVRPVSY